MARHSPSNPATPAEAYPKATARLGKGQQHGDAQGQFVALGGWSGVQDDRQRREQHREQRQGVVAEEHPAPRCQGLVVERIDDGHQGGRAEQPGEQRLAAVPGRGDGKERQAEEQLSWWISWVA